MRNILACFIGLFTFSNIFVLLAANPTNVSEPIILNIEFKGLKRQSVEVVKAQLQSKEKEPFSQKVFEDDIQRLYDTGLFKNIKWVIEALPEGVKIIIEFEENEIVEEIHFTGFKSINPKLFQPNLKLKSNAPFNEYYLKHDLNLILRKYKEEGYYFAEVTSEQKPGSKGVIVVVRVREGPQVKVGKIKIIGNENFPPKRILGIFRKHPIEKIMTTKAKGLLSSQPFNEETLISDIMRIESFYRSEGWLDVNAYIENLVFNPDKTRVDIVIRIEEGKIYTLRKLEVIGNTAITTEEILKELSNIKLGKPVRFQLINSAQQKIMQLYGRKGYIDCYIEPRQYYPAEGLVDITFHIREGQPKYIERIDIIGNTKTRDKVLRREFLVQPGDLMDYGKIEATRHRLGATMFFESLKYDITDGSAPHLSNLLIEVKEARTGMLQLGGGYSANYGFGGRIQFIQNNFDITRLPKSLEDFFSGNAFAGAGQQFALTWQPGITLSQQSVDFTEPFLFNKPLRLSLNYFGLERNWAEYDERRVGGGASLVRRFESDWDVGLGTRWQTIEIANLAPGVGGIIASMRGVNRLRAVKTILGYEKLDSRLLPTRGGSFSFTYEVCGGRLGGDFDFIKSYIKGEYYLPVPVILGKRKPIFNLVGRLGYVTEFDDSREVPFFERFYAGGSDTVRGFRFRTISPKENGLSVGGKLINILNAELIYPVYYHEVAERPYDIIRFFLFYDAGTVENKWQEISWSSFRTSVGFGIRLYIGSVPLTLSMGYPIKIKPGDERDTIQMDIGLIY